MVSQTVILVVIVISICIGILIALFFGILVFRWFRKYSSTHAPQKYKIKGGDMLPMDNRIEEISLEEILKKTHTFGSKKHGEKRYLKGGVDSPELKPLQKRKNVKGEKYFDTGITAMDVYNILNEAKNKTINIQQNILKIKEKLGVINKKIDDRSSVIEQENIRNLEDIKSKLQNLYDRLETT
jgi:hypothetical protein